MLATEIELEVAEAVDGDDRCTQLPRADLGLGQLDPHERLKVDLLAERAEVDAGGDVSRDRSEHVARVERVRHVVEVVALVRQRPRLDDLARRRRERQQPVVGADEDAIAGHPERDRAPVPADAGIDHRQVDADRQVRQRVGEDDRPLRHGLRRDAVRDVDHLRIGSDPHHHPVADADEIVLEAEVGQKSDVPVHLRHQSPCKHAVPSYPITGT